VGTISGDVNDPPQTPFEVGLAGSKQSLDPSAALRFPFWKSVMGTVCRKAELCAV